MSLQSLSSESHIKRSYRSCTVEGRSPWRNAGERLERLYKDYHLSGAEQRVTASLEPSLGGASHAMKERQAEASERYKGALLAVGEVLSPVTFAVCLLDHPAGDWAVNAGMPRAHGPARLVAALEMLVGYYSAV